MPTVCSNATLGNLESETQSLRTCFFARFARCLSRQILVREVLVNTLTPWLVYLATCIMYEYRYPILAPLRGKVRLSSRVTAGCENVFTCRRVVSRRTRG